MARALNVAGILVSGLAVTAAVYETSTPFTVSLLVASGVLLAASIMA